VHSAQTLGVQLWCLLGWHLSSSELRPALGRAVHLLLMLRYQLDLSKHQFRTEPQVEKHINQFLIIFFFFTSKLFLFPALVRFSVSKRKEQIFAQVNFVLQENFHI